MTGRGATTREALATEMAKDLQYFGDGGGYQHHILPLRQVCPGQQRRKRVLLRDVSALYNLVRLYDVNGDEDLDQGKYAAMVEDMAAIQAEEAEREAGVAAGAVAGPGGRWMCGRPAAAPTGDARRGDSGIARPRKGHGEIFISNINMDVRRLLFGALPLIKDVTPLNVTITGSFGPEELMESTLLAPAPPPGPKCLGRAGWGGLLWMDVEHELAPTPPSAVRPPPAPRPAS